jgi:hypothetical protein
MIVQFVESKTGTPVYINPEYVMSLRPDPANMDGGSIIKHGDGETVPVLGDHEDVAVKLARPAE